MALNLLNIHPVPGTLLTILFKKIFFCLFLAVLGLHCCTWAFCSPMCHFFAVISLTVERGL